jgi:hypothetical protein
MSGPGVKETLDPSASLSAPKQSSSRYRYHLSILVVSAAILSVAALLNLPKSGGVEAPFLGILPGICTWKRLFGLDCPGCGLTRCFVALAHGYFRQAWQFNPAGFLIFALLVYQLPFRTVQLWRIGQGGRDYRHGTWMVTTIAWLVIAALLLQWVWQQTH